LTKDQLYKELDYVNASRVSRGKYANLVIENPKLFKYILDIVFIVDDKRSVRAAWVFEFVCKHDIGFLYPHLDYFIANISKLKLDSAIRPCAKILEIITELYYKKQDATVKQIITKTHKTKITEVCFDWLLQDQKVAVKVYSMTVLYHIGTELDWIHPELQLIIERDYAKESAGFKAKCRHIVQKIQKKAK